MAFQLAAEHSLVVLMVERDAAAQVRVSILVNRDGGRHVELTTDSVPAEVLIDVDPSGLEGLRRKPQLPSELSGPVSAWVEDNATAATTLWLHLRKPYGLLGAVPWEALSVHTGRRVLRLPDVLPSRRRELDGLKIGVLASSGRPSSAAIGAVLRLEQTFAQLRGPAVTVEYFTDAWLADWIERDGTTLTRIPERTVHTQPEPGLGGPGRDTDPWTAWVVAHKRAPYFDVLHVVAPAGFTGVGGTPQLQLASPGLGGALAGRDPAVVLDSRALQTLATRTGAYGLAVGRIEQHQQAAAHRGVADAVGSRRAGPVFTTGPDEEGVAATNDAYTLMFTNGGTALSDVGTTPSAMHYVQPAQALPVLAFAAGEPADDSAQESIAAILQQPPPAVSSSGPVDDGAQQGTSGRGPAWTHVVARFAADKRAQVVRLERDERAGLLGPNQQAYLRGLRGATAALDALVDLDTGRASVTWPGSPVPDGSSTEDVVLDPDDDPDDDPDGGTWAI